MVPTSICVSTIMSILTFLKMTFFQSPHGSIRKIQPMQILLLHETVGMDTTSSIIREICTDWILQTHINGYTVKQHQPGGSGFLRKMNGIILVLCTMGRIEKFGYTKMVHQY